MVSVEFSLPLFSATDILTWKYNLEDSNKYQCDIIIGGYLLTTLGINIKRYNITIECGEGPYQGYTQPMTRLNDYDFYPISIKARTFL